MRQMSKKFETTEVQEFFLHRPEKVEFIYEAKGQYNVLLDDEFLVGLDKRSPINGQLILGVNKEQLIEQFTDGSFFIVDGLVSDYRLKDNLSFIHKPDAICALADIIGFSRPINDSGFSSDIAAPRSRTAAFQCNATETLGGQFDINIGFSWSPYSIDINSILELWREICSNGAIATSPLMNHRIPMLNKWEENLDISNQVIRHSFDQMVFPRLQALPKERVSMADVSNLLRIVRDHAESKHLHGSSYRYLSNIQSKLESVFTDDVANMKTNMLKFIPAPVTAFDAMNIATEIATHHTGRDKTDHRAQAFTNSIIFDADRQANQRVDLDKLVVNTEVFNQPDLAFFGQTCH